ncbi:hypothetical protein NC653_024976 [Populus alba x Populus x berolinensis]|uniref:imidazoleglycerol-phosphate dehydratase n=1 Tax=Populus alba x Populus x berolinensis TaxID=444605 RepID=A0AAD6MB24_9ROSI|nr:hypothetical protein NC653_024976 [Populus alba x Populus x berolinensis]
MALHEFTRDLSGRPYLGYDLQIPTQRVGTYDTQLVEHFFQSLVNTSGMTLHIRQLAGRNSHHIIEATFKAFARALRQATEYDPRRLGTVPRFDFFFSSVTSLASKASPLSNMGTENVNDRLLPIWLAGKGGSSGEEVYLSRINGAHSCSLFLAPVNLLKLRGCGHWRMYTENSELWPVGT